MSLINQMLRDLDRRHAPAADRAAMPNVVHVPPPERRAPWLPFGAALVVAAAVAGYLAGGRVETVAPAPREPAAGSIAAALPPPPLPAPAPVEPSAPVQSPPVAAEGSPTAAALPPAAPAKAAGAAASIKARGGGSRQESASAPKDKVVVAAARPAPVAAPAAKESPQPDAGSIDKRPRTMPGREAAEAEYRKAMAALRRGATTEAVEGLHAVLRQDASHASARQALLSLLVEQQQWSEAQTLMEQGLAVDPAQVGWAMALARLQLENGKLPDATETLAHYVGHADQNADYQAFYALLLQKQKRYREAGDRYHAALALKPAESRWWYGLGLSLESDQKPQEARDAFLKAKELGNLPPEVAAAVEQRLR